MFYYSIFCLFIYRLVQALNVCDKLNVGLGQGLGTFFVCLFDGRHDNFSTIKHRMMKLGGQVHCYKSRLSGSPHPKCGSRMTTPVESMLSSFCFSFFSVMLWLLNFCFVFDSVPVQFNFMIFSVFFVIFVHRPVYAKYAFGRGHCTSRKW